MISPHWGLLTGDNGVLLLLLLLMMMMKMGTAKQHHWQVEAMLLPTVAAPHCVVAAPHTNAPKCFQSNFGRLNLAAFDFYFDYLLLWWKITGHRCLSSINTQWKFQLLHSANEERKTEAQYANRFHNKCVWRYVGKPTHHTPASFDAFASQWRRHTRWVGCVHIPCQENTKFVCTWLTLWSTWFSRKLVKLVPPDVRF